MAKEKKNTEEAILSGIFDGEVLDSAESAEGPIGAQEADFQSFRDIGDAVRGWHAVNSDEVARGYKPGFAVRGLFEERGLLEESPKKAVSRLFGLSKGWSLTLAGGLCATALALVMVSSGDGQPGAQFASFNSGIDQENLAAPLEGVKVIEEPRLVASAPNKLANQAPTRQVAKNSSFNDLPPLLSRDGSEPKVKREIRETFRPVSKSMAVGSQLAKNQGQRQAVASFFERLALLSPREHDVLSSAVDRGRKFALARSKNMPDSVDWISSSKSYSFVNSGAGDQVPMIWVSSGK